MFEFFGVLFGLMEFYGLHDCLNEKIRMMKLGFRNMLTFPIIVYAMGISAPASITTHASPFSSISIVSVH